MYQQSMKRVKKTGLGITIEKKLASARLMFCGLGLLIMDFIT